MTLPARSHAGRRGRVASSASGPSAHPPRRPDIVIGLIAFVLLAGGALGIAAYLLAGERGRPDAIAAPATSPGSPPAPVAAVPQVVAPRPGAGAPEIGLADLEGRMVTLNSLRGKTVLVNFWASWCPPCEKEMADLQTLYGEEHDRGLVILGINEGEEPSRVAEFLRRKGITFPTVLDARMEVTKRYEVFGLPNSFVIDPQGVVRARVVGPFTLEQMRGHVNEVRQGRTVEPPRVVSLVAALAADRDRPAAEVDGMTITLGEVDRRLDLESALVALRGGLAPDLTRPEQASALRQQRRAVAERLADERLIAARAAAAGIVVSDAEIEQDVVRLAGELKLPRERLDAELSGSGSDVAALREVYRAEHLIARFVAERVLTGQTDERTDEYDAWFDAARRRAGLRIVLPAD
jgi:peroxiredoxin